MGDYVSERYCHNCDKDTPHEVHDCGHERDSSGDTRTCLTCKWVWHGLTGKYEPPIESDNEGEGEHVS